MERGVSPVERFLHRQVGGGAGCDLAVGKGRSSEFGRVTALDQRTRN